jgi:hypothetical protein
VNHALVHRYCGTKDEMVAASLLAEVEAMSAVGRPELATFPPALHCDCKVDKILSD